MAVQPFFDSPYLLTSVVYFIMVFVFVINRSRILSIIGKLLTPAIILLLLLIIGATLFSFDFSFGETTFPSPFSHGILEGYQTFDAIGAVVVGGVIIISINLEKKKASYSEKKLLITKAGWLAGLALFLIYAGLILTGAMMHDQFEADTNRTALLNGISLKTLGSAANLSLSILVSLACFTTAVGIVAGTADFVRSRFSDSQKAFTITSLIGCILGILMGQFNVEYIIAVALPALMFIYPITIVLILLNILPQKLSSPSVFKTVVLTTILFSIPDFLGSIGFGEAIAPVQNWIPLSKFSMGWVLPALAVFILSNVLRKNKVKRDNDGM
jgi:LIVCS family branched-chain amino acid:cation transporter